MSENSSRPLKPVYVFLANLVKERHIVKAAVVRGTHAQAMVVADPNIIHREDYESRKDAYVNRVRAVHGIRLLDWKAKGKREREAAALEREKNRKTAIDRAEDPRRQKKKPKLVVSIPHALSASASEINNYMLNRRSTTSVIQVLFMTEPAGLCYAAQSVHGSIVRNFPKDPFTLQQLLRCITMVTMVSCFRMPDMLMRHAAVLLDSMLSISIMALTIHSHGQAQSKKVCGYF